MMPGENMSLGEPEDEIRKGFEAIQYLIGSPIDDVRCETCQEWGRTVGVAEPVMTVPCPKCGRRTWLNLGVNLPAGAASSVAAMQAIKATKGFGPCKFVGKSWLQAEDGQWYEFDSSKGNEPIPVSPDRVGAS